MGWQGGAILRQIIPPPRFTVWIFTYDFVSPQYILCQRSNLPPPLKRNRSPTLNMSREVCGTKEGQVGGGGREGKRGRKRERGGGGGGRERTVDTNLIIMIVDLQTVSVSVC